MATLVKKGGGSRFDGPAECRRNSAARASDKISTTVLTEKLSIYGGFAVTQGAHAGIGTLPIVYFARKRRRKISAEAGYPRVDRRVLPFSASGVRRAEFADGARGN